MEVPRNGFDELEDELKLIDVEDPRNWLKLSDLYMRFCNGHALVYKYAEGFYSMTRKSSQEIYAIRNRAFRMSLHYDGLSKIYREKYFSQPNA